MATKIQINSLAALERLLSGDQEFEVEFRKSVLAEYEKKHLLPSIQERVRLLIQSGVEEHIGRATYGGAVIRDQFKAGVQLAVKRAVEQLVQEEVNRGITEYFDDDSIGEWVQKRAKSVLTESIRCEVRAKMEDDARALLAQVGNKS